MEDEAKRENKLAAYFQRVNALSRKKRNSQQLLPFNSETEEAYDEAEENERLMQEKIQRYEQKMLRATLNRE